MAFTQETEKYFENLGKEIERNYVRAKEARARGYDPKDEVEAPLAMTMAAKVVRLIATKYPQLDKDEIIDRILELEKQYGALDNSVSFKIAEEIAKQKYCTFENQMEAMDAGIRVGFAYTTLGVVSSPLEGFTEIKPGKTQNGETYLKAYFSGPIRSAGTTASCMVVMLIDYIRQVFGYARYDPTEQEAKRTVTELYDYHERVTNLQYLPTEDEAFFIGKNIPIQVCGDPTETREVSNFKNLPRIETDCIRGGFCLIIGEGLAQKAKKGQRLLKGIQKNGFTVKDWEWLDEYVELHEKRDTGKTDSSPTYIKDLVAGRPVFGYPGKGFRFRYGRSRVAGFSAVSVHPATMGITNDFIATGTQLKIEKPTKGCVTTPCDLIDGPIIKLKNGTVKKLYDYDEAKKLYKDVSEIIYPGDILFPLGDVMNRNAVLIKPGYVEEWWNLELEKNSGKVDNCYKVELEKAVELSNKFNVPLHPSYIYYWNQINYEQFLGFIDWFLHSRINNGKLLFPFGLTDRERFQVGKRALELIGVPHEVFIENVILENNDTKALLVNLGFEPDFIGQLEINFDFSNADGILEALGISKENSSVISGSEKKLEEISEGEKVLAIINKLSKYIIKDKAGEFIGSRMGRPEKAKLRKLIGSPSVLFPVGNEGGRLRSVNAAEEIGTVRGDFPFNFCTKCNRETIYRVCECCGERTIEKYYCRRCEKEIEDKKCKLHDMGGHFKNTRIDLKHYVEKAREKLGYMRVEVPALIKGVRGTSSEDHAMENLVKGILRAKYNLSVNKDGTIRYDMTELPISHFKPKEIEVNVVRLRELGYVHDCYGKELVSEDQILELKPHDIILPCNVKCGDEKADDVFINAAKFIDELLVKFYHLPAFYNIKKREDIVGQLGVCMAPHNCAGVICRIIGFSKVQGLLASPYMHAAMRRDCDGDEAAIMLLLDVLINFSRSFLPSHRGGTQDAPLVLNGRVYAKEVDDQILDFELVNTYPLSMYESAEKKMHSNKIEIEMVKQRIARGEDPYVNTGFTHDSDNFNAGATCSSYKTLPTMQDKVEAQMDLCVKLRSVDQGDVARLIIDRHFMRDLKGNLRKFSQQSFRCGKCNEIFRRPPLDGKCTKCGNPKLIFTISYGSIVKYLEPALSLVRNYNVPAYIEQDLELTKKYIESIFGRDTEKQQNIDQWF
ncbi:DNA polymerase II large subunit [uncultured archaeon]|nr:DNA polymerase II large subunit [uncultured archaeon]